MAVSSDFRYAKSKLNEVRFPLGGIGAGCISLDGSARFVDWEIKNHPNKESYNGFSHIAVKAERDGKTLDARVMHGRLPPPYMGRGLHSFGGYSYGPARETLCGIPHFDDTVLTGRFPLAEYTFEGSFPAQVSLRAFSPFEPANEFDSSLPLAMLEVVLHNTDTELIDYSIAFTLANANAETPCNFISQEQRRTYLSLESRLDDTAAPAFGQLCLATDAEDLSWQQNWYRGSWFDGLNMFWHDFTAPGHLKDRVLSPVGSNIDVTEHGVLCAHVRAAPGETKIVRFALAWYYPNFEKYWSKKEKHPVWKNWYATVFENAKAVADYGLGNWQKLASKVESFVDTMYHSSLPRVVIDVAASTLAVLKSPTCIRLTDGSFYGWEGAHAREGSCEGSCQHVWNYQYALPLLFPALERSMRELDYTYNLKPSGSMAFRLALPPGSPPPDFRACADGQMGGIIKSYRDWKLCGENRWLTKLWPAIKCSLEFAWSENNPDRWDSGKTGVLTGRQHHTLDLELFGPNSWLTGMYLAALEAAAQMAEAMEDSDFAQACRGLKEQGQSYVEEHLWNGEYYIQKIDLTDISILDPYLANDPGAAHYYWNPEAKELKYQIGEGSSIDQLLGQWHADLNGLGDIFDRERVKTALGAIYKYNFVETMGERANPCRIYCLQDEAGLLICAYPEHKKRPVISAPYAEETMHGFEYAAACHMIQNGLEEEGLHCVRAVRNRYDGERRNPWNEIECGGNYARSMAAWSLVLAYQGLRVNMTRKAVFFARLQASETHRSLWAFSGAWGRVICGGGTFSLRCLGGSVLLREIGLASMKNLQSVTLDSRALVFHTQGNRTILEDAVTLQEGSVLTLQFFAS